MSRTNPTESTQPDQMTPDDVRENCQNLDKHLADQGDHDTPSLLALLTPRKRARLFHVLIGADEALTATEICERAQMDRSMFDPHIEPLLAAGVAKNPGKKGNANVYKANRAHPTVQLLTMAETALRHGVTRDLLDDQFIGDPGAGVDPETGEE